MSDSNRFTSAYLMNIITLNIEIWVELEGLLILVFFSLCFSLSLVNSFFLLFDFFSSICLLRITCQCIGSVDLLVTVAACADG